jgi:thiamine biosynthesis lipoprotein
MIYKLEFKAMGCQMLAAMENPPSQAKDLLAQVPGWFEAWEACLSRFRPGSELNQLNCSSGTEMQVSETLWSVFEASMLAHEQSEGLVTPTLLEALIAAGYDQSFDQVAVKPGPASSAGPRIYSSQAIEFWPESRSIRLPQGMHLDFGGVAKGWAADQAMKRLQSYGPALVDAGGDIAASGLLEEGQSWLVGIENPLDSEASLGTLGLGRCGVATSGRDYRRWKQAGAWKHHIIDPRTGEPAETDVLSATIIAPTISEAEMAAKAVLILGSQMGLDWLDAHPAYAGMLVAENGQVIYGPSFENYLWS